MEVRAVLGNGEMPPPEESALTQGDRAQVMEWLSGEIRTASMLRRSDQNPSSFRRMTAYEYNYALQDLLGLPWQFARDLPPEARSEDGFKNSVEHLHMSVTQLKAIVNWRVRHSSEPPLWACATGPLLGGLHATGQSKPLESAGRGP